MAVTILKTPALLTKSMTQGASEMVDVSYGMIVLIN